LRVFGQIETAKVGVVRSFSESDGRGMVENGRKGKGLSHIVKQKALNKM